MKTNRIILFLGLLCSLGLTAQKSSVVSPNQQVEIQLHSDADRTYDAWYLTVLQHKDAAHTVVIPKIHLGLTRDDQPFKDNLRNVKISKVKPVQERYTSIHGKRSLCSNEANEVVVTFENSQKSRLLLYLRAYNDGVAFRYAFEGKSGRFTMQEEHTSYVIADSCMRWLQKFNPANEGLYHASKFADRQADWAYPALFQTEDQACWFLIHEADLDRTYCGTKLANHRDKSTYQLVFPDAWNGRGTGEVLPTFDLPWQSPWRVVIMGDLSDVVESTLVDDVSRPSVLEKSDWVQPGAASWNYWSDNHGTRSYRTVCAFADLAARMGWPYTLLDWEWDRMEDGGNLNDALQYIHSIGVKPLIWYNSGGDHTWVNSTPKDRMLTHENRMVEFAKLKKLGIAGVKIDFFESEKQDMIAYYLDILEDAAQFEIMVYFHGCLVPRGWARTYPHLMTYEGVRGAEWYNNGPELTTTAPEHNSILAFTRNVVGAMDYTPVTFTNSQYPHITSFGHELALSVLFESGIQHFADRPDGYDRLPDAAKTFLKHVPNAWDDIAFVDGYPGRDVCLARKKAQVWYMGGINSEARPKNKTLPLDFLEAGIRYRVTLIADGSHDQTFTDSYFVVEKGQTLEVRMLRRGGFVAQFEPLKN